MGDQGITLVQGFLLAIHRNLLTIAGKDSNDNLTVITSDAGVKAAASASIINNAIDNGVSIRKLGDTQYYIRWIWL